MAEFPRAVLTVSPVVSTKAYGSPLITIGLITEVVLVTVVVLVVETLVDPKVCNSRAVLIL